MIQNYGGMEAFKSTMTYNLSKVATEWPDFLMVQDDPGFNWITTRGFRQFVGFKSVKEN
jgi:hypothetical protein